MNMTGLSVEQIEELKHSNTFLENICPKNLFGMLWYTTTDQSPVQRTRLLDGTIFDKKSNNYNSIVDKYAMLFFEKTLFLGNAHLAEKGANFKQELDKVYGKDSAALLILKDERVGVVYSFFNRLRNSIAHGSFNFINGKGWVFIGQSSKNIDSNINFYLHINEVERFEILINTLKDCSNNNLVDFQNYVYSLFIPLKKIADNYYLRICDDKIVCFDNTFEFKKIEQCGGKSQIGQLKEYIISRYSNNLNAEISYDYLLLSCSSMSNFQSIKEEFGITVVPSNTLLKHIKENGS